MPTPLRGVRRGAPEGRGVAADAQQRRPGRPAGLGTRPSSSVVDAERTAAARLLRAHAAGDGARRLRAAARRRGSTWQRRRPSSRRVEVRGRSGRLCAMASYSVNPAAVEHATKLIDARQYVLDSDWGEVQPDAAVAERLPRAALLGRVRRVAPRSDRGCDRRDQGAVRLRVRRLPAGAPHRADRVRLPGVGVAAQGCRAGRARPAAAPRPGERPEPDRHQSRGGNTMTDEDIDPAVPPSGTGCADCDAARPERAGGCTCDGAPVRPHRLLRHLAGPARHGARERRPATASSRASSPTRTGSTTTRPVRCSTGRSSAAPALAPGGAAGPRPGGAGARRTGWSTSTASARAPGRARLVATARHHVS